MILDRLRRLLRREEPFTYEIWKIEKIFYPEDFIVIEMSPRIFRKFARQKAFVIYEGKDARFLFDGERRHIFTTWRRKK